MFKDRARRFEAEYSYREALKFRIEAIRDRQFGHWAAAQLGLTNQAADAYAQTIIRHNLEFPRAEAGLRKVIRDFAAAGQTMTEDEIRAKMIAYHEQAIHDLSNSAAA